MKHIRPPRRLSSSSSSGVINLEEKEDYIDLSSGTGIVTAWHESWTPYSEAMENFQCTRPSESSVD